MYVPYESPGIELESCQPVRRSLKVNPERRCCSSYVDHPAQARHEYVVCSQDVVHLPDNSAMDMSV
jgi:hypothetical protein